MESFTIDLYYYNTSKILGQAFLNKYNFVSMVSQYKKILANTDTRQVLFALDYYLWI